MNRVIATLLTAVLWSGAPLVAAAGEGCDTLGEHVAFVGAKGLSIDFAGVDAIAYWHVGDNDKVVVYERSDAEALVSDLAAAGETDPTLLDAEAWRVAQVVGCEMRPGNTCSGACPGTQTCKRVKKPGKDICACMVGPKPGPGPGPR